jgi:hypothetical protein
MARVGRLETKKDGGDVILYGMASCLFVGSGEECE